MSPKVAEALAKLRGVAPAKPARKYQQPLHFYAGRFSRSERQIKRYAEAGAPLDDDDAMGEWLALHGRTTTPKGETDADFEAPSIVPPIGDVESPLDVPVKLEEDFFEGEGVLAAIERLKKAEKERAATYMRAIQGKTNSQTIQLRLKEWQSVIEALRKLEKDAPEIRKQNRLTVDVAEVEAEIAQLFASLRAAAENLPGRASAKLVGLKDRHEIAEVLEKEVAVLVNILRNVTIGAPTGEEEGHGSSQ